MTMGDTSPKIKVLRIIARLNIGGPAIHTILLTRYMQTLGYETLLVTGEVAGGEGDMSYLAEAQRVKPVVISQLGSSFLPLNDLMAFIRILRLLFKFRPHIVHTHTAKAGTLGRLAATIYNKVQGSRLEAESWACKIVPGREVQKLSSWETLSKCKIVQTFHGCVLKGYFSHGRKGFFSTSRKPCQNLLTLLW